MDIHTIENLRLLAERRGDHAAALRLQRLIERLEDLYLSYGRNQRSLD